MDPFNEFTDSSTHRALKGKLRRIEGLTLKHAHRFLVRRWSNLQEVRQRAGLWLVAVLLLSAAVLWQTTQTTQVYSAEVPSENTTYTEGVVGSVDNLNPIFASSDAERSAARLLFANLLQYDNQGDLVGDLAQSWTSDAEGKVYTITLRHDARWSDGIPITAQDVVYTFNAIKDADVKSPLYSSWRNVLVSQDDDYTVKFTLPTSYTPFLNSLTIGILPQHTLGQIPATQLRNSDFNRGPTVTSGPFTFQDVRALDDKQTHFLVRMVANPDYFLGAPKLSRFQLHAYSDQDQALNAFRSQEVAAVSDLSTQQILQLGKTDAVRTESPLYDAVYAFFKMDSPVVQDVKVRDALQLATDRAKIIAKLDNRVTPVTGPLLPGQLGYRADLSQPAPDMKQAAQLLDAAGWRLNSAGKRVKDGQPLKLQLATISTGDYPIVAQEVMNEWSQLGISFESQLIRPADIQQNVLVPRAYDVLIYDIALGRDPDVYAYWHSSQANERGFNLSDYKSAIVDDALDSARGRSDPVLREAKYRRFIQQWLSDVPAVGLYQPTLSYVQTKSVTSFTPHPLVDQTDRYFNVQYWSANKQLMRPTL